MSRKTVIGLCALGLLLILGVAATNSHTSITQPKTSINNATVSEPVTTSTYTAPTTTTPVETQPVQSAPATENVSVSNVTSPASPGSTATLTAQTMPNSNCSITVHYKSGPSTAAGLYAHQADSSGTISWSWMVGTRTTPGTWPISLTCTSSSGSATASTSFVVD